MTKEELYKQLSKLSLLYVEDETSVREATAHIFQRLFNEVRTAINGIDGIEKYKKKKPDMIITDLRMKEMDGLEMISIIRKTDPEIPILVVSANDESSYFIKSIELDVNGYIMKPFRLEELNIALTRVVEVMELRRQLECKNKLMKDYQEITDLSGIVSKANPDGTITYVNDAFCQVTGYTREELIGKNHNIVSHPDTPITLFEEMWETILKSKKLFQSLMKNKDKNGNVYYSQTSIMPILDEFGEVMEFIGFHNNVTELMQPLKQLNDYLNNAKNPLVALIQIEGYSDLAKYFGEEIAQDLESAFVKQFETEMIKATPNGFIFDLGDGKIAIACDQSLTQSLENELVQNLKTLQQHIYDAKLKVSNKEYDITAIIAFTYGEKSYLNALEGISLLEKTGENFIVANNLLENAQMNAKQNLRMLEELKYAIDNNHIVNYFQPIIDNSNGEISKYESLVRMRCRDEKLLSPYFFLDIAKEGKAYYKITSIVLKNTFKALKQTDKVISINLSAIDIEHRDTREFILKLLNTHNEDAHRIIFELLEEESIQDIKTLRSFISYVKSLGVRIAIDDFGSGYSNYQRLMDYQPDILKIDGSLIKNIHEDEYVRSVVTSLVSFAKDNKIQTVAEFVESKEVYDTVCEIGIDFSQGYHFSKPHPAEELV